jgi:hypothetical protein
MCFSRHIGSLLILLLSQCATAGSVVNENVNDVVNGEVTKVADLVANKNVTEVMAAENPATVQLNITPDTCVSLQQGRICYSTVTASWQSQQDLDLCLALDNEILQCWTQQSQGKHKFEFASPQTSVVRLLQQQQVMAQAKIKVNWVHKASKVTRHWRLF